MSFAPLVDVADFASLDIHQFGCGVVAFVLGEPEPTDTRSRWAGWLAQAMHEGAIPKDARVSMLAIEASIVGAEDVECFS